MIKFIFKLLKFIIPLFLIIFAVLLLASKNHQFEFSKMYSNVEFENIYKSPSKDLVAIGNSKLLNSIDKNTLKEEGKYSVAMLGYSSANISVSKLTLETYLNNCSVKPNLVLLEVSWFTFNNHRTQLHKIVGDLFLRDFKLWTNLLGKNASNLLPKVKKATTTSLKRFVGVKSNLKETTYLDKIDHSLPKEKGDKFNFEEFEAGFPEHLAGVDELLLNDFNAIVDLCKANKIDLILFTAPEAPEYNKYQKDAKRIKSIYQDLSKSNKNIFYLDYTFGSDLWDDKYEDWLVDSHHINQSTLFTKDLIRDIKKYTNNKVFKD
ncbi:hypothetical protein [Polaribacter sargassicola]|uniref:hypothetical protein n=1 Tax=Polaribacter sargassicola TaxID=2836891 RepID=UPI001F4068AF|nr:hypothetical protein [Polaribacter sp. DS7-9]MCG1037818.1 hypothetical protein [Polaribacter sp. DS7-9]